MEQLDSRHIYRNPWIEVREDSIRRSDGSTGIYGVVRRADFALVVPLEGGRLHLVEQYRYPVRQRCWEFPAGTLPGHENGDPIELARRELREETGLRAGTLTYLGRLDAAPATLDQRGSVYLATDLTAGEPEREPEEQDMRAAWFERSEVETMIRDGVITDAHTVAAYTLLLLSERN
ncbi:NUDIX hydrolase [Nocardia aurantia]|uniref:Methanol dehydrogenase activator n=1 Tax=Nocardia aurantia TaxID=2585199 RepID=A0A7K0DN70_9NOCA|nr:NUDIX hydrolase [Nocardia aurantia]MQY27137.1 Methanol dehydrogenase activator [Nocardia aurantia]